MYEPRAAEHSRCYFPGGHRTLQKSAINLCFTTPATFIFTKFVPKKLNKLSTLGYRSLIDVGIVELDGQLPCQPSNKHHHHGVAFATTAAWLWRISQPNLREPLWKGLPVSPLINLGTQHDGRSARTWMKRV
jgi:hypothetical protein